MAAIGEARTPPVTRLGLVLGRRISPEDLSDGKSGSLT